MNGDEVRVSYLTMSGPALWGSVGSVVTWPGDGRWVILRHLDQEKGPQGYFVVDLLGPRIVSPVVDTEKAARAFIAQMGGAGA
jgi:hypothetical protein